MFGVVGTLATILPRGTNFQVRQEIVPRPVRAVELDFPKETRFDKHPPSGERLVHPYLLLAVDLFRWLPLWGAVTVLPSVPFGLCGLGCFLVQRFERNINEAIRKFNEPLCDAVASVQSIEPAGNPLSFNADSPQEEFEPDRDSREFADSADWFWIDATITPRDRDAAWAPRNLELVSGDFDPTADFEVCEEAGSVYAVEVWKNERFLPLREVNVTGPQRLRMLCAVPQRLREAKFACQFTCFGRLALPSPATACNSGFRQSAMSAG